MEAAAPPEEDPTQQPQAMKESVWSLSVECVGCMSIPCCCPTPLSHCQGAVWPCTLLESKPASCKHTMSSTPGPHPRPSFAAPTPPPPPPHTQNATLLTSLCVAVGALCGLARLGRLLLCCQPGHWHLIVATLTHAAGPVAAHAVIRPQGAVTVDVDLLGCVCVCVSTVFGFVLQADRERKDEGWTQVWQLPARPQTNQTDTMQLA